MDILEKILRLLIFIILSYVIVKLLVIIDNNDLLMILLSVSIVYIFMNIFYPIVIIK
jgi:hypothetical protein